MHPAGNNQSTNPSLLFVHGDTLQKTDLLITVYARGIDGGGDGIRVRDIRVAAGDVWDLRVGGYFATGADIVWVSTEGDV